jgi:mono/diheme cytochrome c family protein
MNGARERTRLCLATALIGVVGFGAWPGAEGGGVAPGHAVANAVQAADGARIYNAVCASCHQVDGTGITGMFPPVAGSEWVVGDEGVLVRIILHGVTGEMMVRGDIYDGTMPPFGTLSNAEVAAVATYMRRSWGNSAPAVTAATVARIRTATARRRTPWTVRELSPPK